MTAPCSAKVQARAQVQQRRATRVVVTAALADNRLATGFAAAALAAAVLINAPMAKADLVSWGGLRCCCCCRGSSRRSSPAARGRASLPTDCCPLGGSPDQAAAARPAVNMSQLHIPTEYMQCSKSRSPAHACRADRGPAGPQHHQQGAERQEAPRHLLLQLRAQVGLRAEC